ncbi:TCR/Tet family MFS transporter [Frigidibacter sp. MR17.24]|uniref:TCR/Tet family MFS transporter n=1 Tax=Frigidibacter sp. MR17.24 TaxID=3127345 RepID=UPI003012B0C8
MPSRLALPFILITVMIDAVGIGLILPVLPGLIEDLTGAGLGDAALWGGLLASGYAVMQFLFGPLLGNLSDRFGRRPVILASLAMMALNYLAMAVAGSIWLLFAGRLVSGVTGATHAAANAVAADISGPDDRARRFGQIGAALGAGFVAGPLLGGLLATIDLRAPFWAAAGLAAANLVFGLLALPETVTPANRRPFRWARANPLGAFRAVARLPGLGRMLTIYGLYAVAMFVWPSVWAFYGAVQFGWDPVRIGGSLALYGAAMALVQAVLVGRLTRRFGDRGTLYLGMGIELVTYLFYGVVTSGGLALLFTPVSALGSVVMPALQSRMSRAAAADAQGELQGVIGSLMAVAMCLSPLVMTAVFGAFTRPGGPLPHLPGAPFLVSAVLIVTCLALLRAEPRLPRPADADAEDEPAARPDA